MVVVQLVLAIIPAPLDGRQYWMRQRSQHPNHEIYTGMLEQSHDAFGRA